MVSYNRIILIGNLTRNPELRYTPSGLAVATVTIAVNTRYRQGEEVKEETLFIDAIVFGRQAENCLQYLEKGNPVLIEGRLRERRWDYEGQKRSKFEVIASGVKFLSTAAAKKKNGGTQSESEPAVDEVEASSDYPDCDPF
ncbi:single-stranded DNA-binding protein [Thermodesulfovibrio thiophilus]|uniref:single-stranded DNA-binding protein n=1 Tax=Thermodesulfovibrio thiophilus TaxID=340095 RepID=UPI000401698E|nr:single-stranded DNA-binding protein [Thermodesulfovibrio thiophilus]